MSVNPRHPKRSVFRDFISALRKHWRTELPEVRPVKVLLGPMMPKARTFYAGFAPALGMHVFVNFQHSPMAWQVGQLTINMILSRSPGAPESWGSGFPPDDGVSFAEGNFRISGLLGENRTSGGTCGRTARRSSRNRGGRKAMTITTRSFPKPPLT